MTDDSRTPARAPRVVLIVDNPLRDLDGLVLVARELARRGAEAFLAPMYDQAFVVERVKPDVVVANYVRPNNARLLLHYRRQGVRVVVVDTEGAAGKAAEDLAALLAHTGLADLADAYCVWGQRQADAIIARKVLPAEQVKITGCPRYDFVAPPWREALPAPDVEPGFVLINTNFAAISPRFSGDQGVERESLIKLGLAADYVDARLRDEQIARQGVIDLVGVLAERFPDRKFVLRPHPFEDSRPYEVLERHSNFAIRQEGTSLEWLAAASLLIHLNCSTAVEAAMLGKPSLTPAWLDTPSLMIAGPSSVSRHIPDTTGMIAMVETCFQGGEPERDDALLEAKEAILRDTYFAVDGRTAGRVADVIMTAAARGREAGPAEAGRPTITDGLRRILGPKLWYRGRALFRPGLGKAYAAKAPDSSSVEALIDRLNGVDPTFVAKSSTSRQSVAVGALIAISPQSS